METSHFPIVTEVSKGFVECSIECHRVRQVLFNGVRIEMNGNNKLLNNCFHSHLKYILTVQ